MKVNFKVKMKVTIEFLVEKYFRNDLHFFEKYFIWGNIQPSRYFLDTLYSVSKHFVSLIVYCVHLYYYNVTIVEEWTFKRV